MPTQAKREGNARHIAKLDVIKIQPYKEEGAAIRAAAAAAGMSVQRYILEAVREKMEHERTEVIHDGLSAGGTGTESEGRQRAAGNSGNEPEDISMFSDSVDIPRAAVGISPTHTENHPIAELSPDAWAEWARRQDDESLEAWKTRVKKSNIGISPIDIMKRIGKLPAHDRNLILETDPT